MNNPHSTTIRAQGKRQEQQLREKWQQLTTVSDRLQLRENSVFCLPSERQKWLQSWRTRVKSPPQRNRSHRQPTKVINGNFEPTRKFFERSSSGKGYLRERTLTQVNERLCTVFGQLLLTQLQSIQHWHTHVNTVDDILEPMPVRLEMPGKLTGRANSRETCTFMATSRLHTTQWKCVPAPIFDPLTKSGYTGCEASIRLCNMFFRLYFFTFGRVPTRSSTLAVNSLKPTTEHKRDNPGEQHKISTRTVRNWDAPANEHHQRKLTLPNRPGSPRINLFHDLLTQELQMLRAQSYPL